MALWQVKVIGLVPVFEDKHSLPFLTEREISVNIEESKIMLVSDKARDLAIYQGNDMCDCKVVDIQRIDKKTDVKYNEYINFGRRYYSNHEAEIYYKLTESQLSILKGARYNILNRLLGNTNDSPIYLSNTYQFINIIGGKIHALYDNEGFIVDPKDAEVIIKGLQWFYYNITTAEYKILNIDSKSGRITKEQMMYLKSYIGEYQTNDDASSKPMIFREYDSAIRDIVEKAPNHSVDLLKIVIDWISENESDDSLIKKLHTLKIYDVSKINLIVSISTLKNILDIWDDNINNSSEEFWQQVLQNNSIILSQLFSYPVVLTKGKAYVGGKDISNSKGNIVDFLMTNKLTKNSILIEIKTPITELIGRKYREGIYNISQELTGAIVQASSYKDSLMKDFQTLARNPKVTFEVFNPTCLVIAGNFQRANLDDEQRRSFELFRSGLKDVQIITYDELFEKIKVLLNLLEGR